MDHQDNKLNRVGNGMSDPTLQAGILVFWGQLLAPIVSAVVAWLSGRWSGGGKFKSEIADIRSEAESSQQKCRAENALLREASSMLVAAINALGNTKPAVTAYVHKIEVLLAKLDQ